MSGLSFSNISAGFGQASDAASHAADVKAREELEQMRDARAENLARLNWTRDMLKQKDMLDRQSALQTSQQAFAEKSETERQSFLQGQQQRGQENYLDVLDRRSQAGAQAEQARLDAADRAQRQAEKARDDRQQEQLRASTRVDWQKAIQEHDRQEAQLLSEISKASQANLDIAGESDPQKRSVLMANDPVIGPMLSKYAQLTGNGGARDAINTQYALALHNLQDPDFKGVVRTPSEQSGAGGAGGAPNLIQPGYVPNDGGSARTPNNPLAPTVPAYPTNNAADNAAAIDKAPAGSPPSSSAAGTPPLTGQQRPPVTSMVRPLNPAPQLIPTPGLNGPSVAAGLSSIGNPVGAPPQLIPTAQGF
jgi:hypothetical protein